MVVTLDPVLIVLCSFSVWIKFQVRILSPLCCTDLIIGCNFRWQEDCSEYHCCCSSQWQQRAVGLLVRARGLLVPVPGSQGDLRSPLLVGGVSHRLRQPESWDLRVPVMWSESKVQFCFLITITVNRKDAALLKGFPLCIFSSVRHTISRVSH